MEAEQIQAGVRKLVGVINANLGMPDMVPQLMRLLADGGEPVSVEQLAAAGGWPVEEVQAELARQPGVDWDDDGRVAGFGLTLHPTPHAFTFDDRTVYGFCATDALHFPGALGRAGVVESTCPATGQRIRIEVTPSEIVRTDPPEAVVSKVHLTEAVGDVRELCNLGNFFSSVEAAADWLAAYPQGEVIPIADEFKIVRRAAAELGWTAPSTRQPSCAC